MLVKVEKIKRSKMSVPVRNGEQRTGRRAGVNGAENPRSAADEVGCAESLAGGGRRYVNSQAWVRSAK